MKKWLPLIIVVVFAAWVVSTLRPKSDSPFNTADFGRLPVLLNGRVQPMDSVARNTLLQFRNKQVIYVEESKKTIPAIDWLIEALMKPEVADDRKAFRIDHPEMLGMLELPETEKHFSYNQLKAKYEEIGKQADRILEVERIASENQTPFEKQIVRLYNNLIVYQRLKLSLRPPTSEDFASELESYKKMVAPGVEAVRAREAGKEYDQKAFDAILKYLGDYDVLSRYAYLPVVPPPKPEVSRDDWKNVGEILMESVRGGEISPAVTHYANMVSAYRLNKPEQFNSAIAEYQKWLQPTYAKEVKKGRMEHFYNSFQGFYKAMVIYVFAFLLACGFWFNWADWMRRSALYLVMLAFVIHTFCLVMRMVLEGRPPVTNLYSSAIFVGWSAAVLGMVLERIYKDGIGAVIAALSGFATLVIAHNLALGGDTMEMMRAVLDTNFWLATHVVVVTLGYAATFVAGLLAIIYIARGVFTPTLNDSTAKALSRMVYGIVCFATLFSFVGTVLGGIWADQSWGRFWGWDPKENGALMIVIWNAAILHARWGGLVRERGIMIMAVIGNIVTSFSWFGVNMLGVGLHSYGFMDSGFKWLMLFVASQVLLIGFGLIPLKFWTSNRIRLISGRTPDDRGKKAAATA